MTDLQKLCFVLGEVPELKEIILAIKNKQFWVKRDS